MLIIACLIGSAILYTFFHRIARENARTAEIDAATVEAEYQAALREARDTRDTLQRDLDRMTRERVDLDGELNRLKAEAQARETELTKAFDSLEETQSALAAALRQTAFLTKELDSVRSQAEREAEAHRAALSELKMRTEAESLAWAEKRGGLEQQLAETTRTLDTLKESAPQREITALRARIVSLEQKIDALGNQRNELSRALRAIRSLPKSPVTD